MRNISILALAAFVALSVWPSLATAESKQAATVKSAARVIQEISNIPAGAIPQSLMENSQAIAIIPDVVKLGFVLAGRRGHGVLLERGRDGTWSNPIFVTVTGGSIGWQVGVQSTDVVLVFKSVKSVDGIMNGKFTLGADAAVAAGPVGRRAEIGTDVRLSAEVYSYSRSRGLFAGVSLEGSAIEVDHAANSAYYQSPGITSEQVIAAVNLPTTPDVDHLKQILAIQAPATNVVAVTQSRAGGTSKTFAEVEAGRIQLAHAVERLNTRVDERWVQYFSIPQAVFVVGGMPLMEELNNTRARFDTISYDSRYQMVAEIPEFQIAHQLLKNYTELRSNMINLGDANQAVLPAPPGTPGQF